jgi:protocatechuate 3,4-dioxygenase beta subunit
VFAAAVHGFAAAVVLAGPAFAAPVSVVVLAGPEEPGDRLVVTGRVLAEGGAPVAGARVLAYHADASGLYTRGPRDDPREARLKGTAVTGADGRYELRTIRPAPYPRGGVPAHIHYLVTPPGGGAQDFEVVFEGDADVTAAMRAQSARGGPFLVRPLQRDDAGGWRVSADLRLR